MRSSCAEMRFGRALLALTSRSNKLKSSERILGAQVALKLRSPRAQIGKKGAQMGKIALLARHERICKALINFSKFISIFKKSKKSEILTWRSDGE